MTAVRAKFKDYAWHICDDRRLPWFWFGGWYKLGYETPMWVIKLYIPSPGVTSAPPRLDV